MRNSTHIRMVSQSGQVLLIAILLSTVLLTVGISIAQLTTQDTKVAKLQEDSSRARAAAEAGIEAALGQSGSGSINIGSLLNDSSLSGSAVYDTAVSPEFTTPLISKDAQYTFYLFGYDSESQSILTGTTSDDLRMNRIEPSDSGYCDTDQEFAVELSFIDATPTTGGIVQRYLIDECGLLAGTRDEYSFGDTIPMGGLSPDPHIIIARIISPNNSFEGAKLEFENAAGNDWPIQGRTVVSTASVGSEEDQNVTKKVRLFQSHPQFPAEFFVTSM